MLPLITFVLSIVLKVQPSIALGMILVVAVIMSGYALLQKRASRWTA